MDRVQAAIDAMLKDVAVHAEPWDGIPRLAMIMLKDGEPYLAEARVPPHAWGYDRPPRILETIAKGTAAAYQGQIPGLPRQVAPPGLHGAAFLFKGWGVFPGPEWSPEEEARFRDLGDRHMLYTHPDRVEVRIMCGVDRSGRTYQSVVRHDNGELVPTHGLDVTGTIPESLDQLVSGMLGVDLPPRREPSGPEPG